MMPPSSSIGLSRRREAIPDLLLPIRQRQDEVLYYALVICAPGVGLVLASFRMPFYPRNGLWPIGERLSALLPMS
jgi:hypothetical protein